MVYKIKWAKLQNNGNFDKNNNIFSNNKIIDMETLK